MAGASISINIPAIASSPEQVGARKMIMFYDNRASRALLLGAGALLACGATVKYMAYRDEARHRRLGKLLVVRGHRLHVVERGTGPCVVLLHGTGAMVEDLQSSGLVEGLAAHLPARHRGRADHNPDVACPGSAGSTLRLALLFRSLNRSELDYHPLQATIGPFNAMQPMASVARAMRAEATEPSSRLALVDREC